MYSLTFCVHVMLP